MSSSPARFVLELGGWWVRRGLCRLLRVHSSACQGRPDHAPGRGTWVDW